jgi:hypothetical protein
MQPNDVYSEITVQVNLIPITGIGKELNFLS